jgi:hypothetical protein
VRSVRSSAVPSSRPRSVIFVFFGPISNRPFIKNPGLGNGGLRTAAPERVSSAPSSVICRWVFEQSGSVTSLSRGTPLLVAGVFERVRSLERE